MARYEERDDSYDLLNQYLHEIAQVPRLTPERERELGKRVQENDKAALEELVKANLRFVVSYAKKYRNSHVLFLDLINEGNIGLIHAAKKFDPDKNVKFITYAVWWIRQSILHALSEQGGAFRLPPKRANLMYRLERAIGAAMTDGKEIPTADELAAELGISVKEVQTLLRANSDNFSLNAELDDESHTELAEMIEQTSVPSAEDTMQVQGRRDELLAHMSELSPKERLVLSLRHGVTDNVPKRLVELSAFLNHPREKIVTVLRTATTKVCEALSITHSELAQLLLYTNPNAKAWWRFWYELGDLDDGMTPEIARERMPALELLKQQGAVQKTVESLPIEEKTILRLRYGVLQDDELTLRDIGEILGLSRERVRQIESRAEAKCRRSVRRR
ncbi:MAG: sigma-70 family RNA polymerase sigma factor [Acidobacteria bacterium]|nr:sigma-70 family RNA polymerase sigma factor [Acidobacteriota bacterium]MBV9067454.1 sigma-70 family RNA polymerase sigma factor [Acidobacteriota bacterium]MBV9185181.1 sigma-70 family RNA polymerase sigma factor [Acidobacteriota bacterium]